MSSNMGDVYENIFRRAEAVSCRAVNAFFAKEDGRGAVVTPSVLYEGKKNVPLPVAAARHFTFHLLHDRYGLPYRVIARHAGMNVTSVMKKTAKVRDYIISDYMYSAINDIVGGIIPTRCRDKGDDEGA